ncbi:MAG: cache domain-containing protein [Patescibacteria group bacterium]
MNIIIGIIYLFGCLSCVVAVVLFSRWKIYNKQQVSSFSIIFLACLMAAFFCAAKTVQSFSTAEVLVEAMDYLSEMLYVLFVLNGLGVLTQMWRTRYRSDYKIEGIKPIVLVLVLLLEFLNIIAFWSISYFYCQAKNVSIKQDEQFLYSVADERATHISDLVENYREWTIRYAQNSSVVDCAARQGSNHSCSFADWNNIFAEAASKNSHISAIISLDKNGKVIGASQPISVGTDWSDKKEFINRDQAGYFSDIFSTTVRDENDKTLDLILVGVSAPIMINSGESAVLAVYFVPNFIYEVLSNERNLGSTGEAFLVNGDGLLLSPRRFDEQKFIDLSGRADVKDCLNDINYFAAAAEAGRSTNAGRDVLNVFENEYGRTIFGSHAAVRGIIKNLHWCVVVEMGEKEAMSFLNEDLIKAAVSAATVVAVLMAVFVAVFGFIFNKR